MAVSYPLSAIFPNTAACIYSRVSVYKTIIHRRQKRNHLKCRTWLCGIP